MLGSMEFWVRCVLFLIAIYMFIKYLYVCEVPTGLGVSIALILTMICALYFVCYKVNFIHTCPTCKHSYFSGF